MRRQLPKLWISYKLLRRHHACKRVADKFKMTFELNEGQAVRLTATNLRVAAREGLPLSWLLYRILTQTAYVEMSERMNRLELAARDGVGNCFANELNGFMERHDFERMTQRSREQYRLGIYNLCVDVLSKPSNFQWNEFTLDAAKKP